MSLKKSKPSHPEAKKFQKSGFFKDIKNWSDLKRRIAKLGKDESTTVEGDAFEVFVEWFLVEKKKSPKVIPADLFTSAIKKKYHFPSKMPDAGADGLFLAPDGRWTAYQAKFRGNQKTLTWGELGTFFGVSEYTPSRCVATTCQEIVKAVGEMKKHDGRYFTIREEDFKRLTKNDFAKFENWVNRNEEKPVEEFKLRDDQVEAIKKIDKKLNEDDRAQAIYACGAGKTFLGIYYAKDKLKKIKGTKNLVFLCPSLQLMRQAYLDYLEHYYEPDVRMVAVCSDKDITDVETEIKYDSSDAGFPATTDPKTLKKILKGSKHNVVFCTYQSLQVLKDAGIKVQLAILDEAHRTATDRGSIWAASLDDSFIKMDKRLFMTATPRRRRSLKYDVTSMDNVDDYGDRAVTLNFSQAKELGIVCDFKVIVSVITSNDINRDFLNSGGVRDGDGRIPVRAIQRAHQVSLKKAIKKFNLKKIFSFHNRREVAKEFTSDTPEGIGAVIKGVGSYYVDGKMSAGERAKILEDHSKEKVSITSCAKCLSEGINLPETDCVAIIQPRKSPEDIIQIIGRCMRTYKGKKFGYLFIPVYVEVQEGETEEEAIQNTKFEQVIAVANAMREHSDAFENLLEVIGVSRGRGITGRPQRVFEQIFEWIGPSVSMTQLRKSICTRILDGTLDSWDVHVGEIQKFIEEHGHSNVPRSGKYNKLGQWVLNQRSFKSKGILSKARVESLDQVGFCWDSELDQEWKVNFQKLVDFKKKYGHTLASQSGKHKKLGSWVAKQRREYLTGSSKKNTPMPLWKADALNSIDFSWCAESGTWLKLYETVKLAMKNGEWKAGHPQKAWVSLQKKRIREADPSANITKAKCSLTYKECEELLAKIGITTERLDVHGRPVVDENGKTIWDKKYERLASFIKSKGRWPIRSDEKRQSKEELTLANFVYENRSMRLGTQRFGESLTDRQFKLLDDLGMSWKKGGEYREEKPLLEIIKIRQFRNSAGKKAWMINLGQHGPDDQKKQGLRRQFVCLKTAKKALAFSKKKLKKNPDIPNVELVAELDSQRFMKDRIGSGPRKKGEYWTKEKLRVLKKHFKKMTDKEMSNTVLKGINESAIRYKRWKLQLKKG